MGLFDRLLKPNIRKFESRGDIKALTHVVEADERLDLRIEAIDALSRIASPQAIDCLVATLSSDKPEVARAAEDAVTDIGSASGAALVGALAGPAGDNALKILMNLGDETVEWLRAACQDQSDVVRSRALAGLVEFNAERDEPETREILFRILLAALGDRSPECRIFAATNLETLGDAKAGRALAAQLKDGDEAVRSACRNALHSIGEAAVPYLLDALADRNPNSRRLAAELLGEVCRGEVDNESRRVALAGLADRASDSNTEIAAAVRYSLESIPSEVVITTRLEFLADPERSDHEDIQEFLNLMLTHGVLTAQVQNHIIERMNALGFQPASRPGGEPSLHRP